MSLETLAFGYGLIEGPREDADGNLYFSDVIHGGVYRRTPAGEITTVVPKRRGVGGIALHADGGLVLSGRNLCHVREGETRIVLDLPEVGGFNDLFAAPDGSVYVGSLRSNPFQEGPRVPGELHRVRPGGGVDTLYGGVELSNGIGLSPDGTRLYHSDTAQGTILVHTVKPGGEVEGGAVFARLPAGAPDGLAVDEAGGIWVAAYGGGRVFRFAASGSLDHEIEIPARMVTSLCFAGSDRHDLIVVTADNTAQPERQGTIFRTRVEVAGLAPGLARV